MGEGYESSSFLQEAFFQKEGEPMNFRDEGIREKVGELLDKTTELCG